MNIFLGSGKDSRQPALETQLKKIVADKIESKYFFTNFAAPC